MKGAREWQPFCIPSIPFILAHFSFSFEARMKGMEGIQISWQHRTKGVGAL